MEMWKDIVGYEGMYQVSSAGRIRSVDRIIVYSNGRAHYYTGKILNGFVKPDGYMAVDLYRYGKKKKFYVHRLVAEHFVKNKDCLHNNEVNHIDENKLNNSADNLEWCTSSENKLHGTCIERANKTRKRRHTGEKPVGLFDLSGKMIQVFDCIKDAAQETGIDRKSIYNACNGRVNPRSYTWKYIA